jgi:hypothetical protein
MSEQQEKTRIMHESGGESHVYYLHMPYTNRLLIVPGLLMLLLPACWLNAFRRVYLGTKGRMFKAPSLLALPAMRPAVTRPWRSSRCYLADC